MFPEILVLFMSLLNTSICAPSTTVNRIDSEPVGPLCYSCASVEDPYLCNVTTQCGSYEQCYTDEYATSPVSSIFNVGCRRISECYSAVVRTSRTIDEERLKCEECCHGNLCNNGGCSSGPAKGNVCYKCSFINDPQLCKHEATCLADEQCFIEKVLTQNFRVKYTLGCVDNVECETLHHFGRAVRKRESVLSTMCATCCHGDKCNDICSPQGFETDSPETSVESTPSSLGSTSPSVTDNGFFSDTTNGMPYTSPSMTEYTTIIETSGLPFSRPSVSQDTIEVDSTRNFKYTSPSRPEDTTVVDRSSTMTTDTSLLDTSEIPYTSHSKNNETTSVDATTDVSYTGPLMTEDTTSMDTTSHMSYTIPLMTEDTTSLDTTSDMSYTSPLMNKDTTVIDTTSGIPYTSPSFTKDTTITDITDTTVGTHSSSLPGSSVHEVTTSLSSSTASSATTHDNHHTGLLCFRCDRVTDPRDCKYTTICGAGQECHVAKYATQGGYIYYKLGCKTDQECQALRVGRRENEAALAERCCTNHSGCNRDIFKSPNGLTCGSCRGMASPADCEEVASCSASEVCARTIYVSDQFFVRYTLQCINRAACGGRVLHRALSDDEKSDLCCDTNYCNMAHTTNTKSVQIWVDSSWM
ncbi:papilin-like isoform X2 [Haliotis asinina]|uniref:papilin-like isoform X2 n=1 Tax=Haliotis asinina TaxID=109174 RepID=UPI003531B7E9